MASCGSCGLSKPASAFTRNQLTKGAAARCKTCVHGTTAPPARQEATGVELCCICGIQHHGSVEEHEQTKRHVLNLDLHARPGYVRIDTSDIAEKVYQRVGVAKGSNWASEEQVIAAKGVRTIRQSGVFLERFKAIRGYASPEDLCTLEQQQFALSLVEFRSSGLHAFHFKRSHDLGFGTKDDQIYRMTSGSGKFGQWCSPEQLEAASAYQQQCTIRIDGTGLESSRFQSLGMQGEFCSQQDKEEAALLIDAQKPKPGHKLAVPLGCYDDLACVVDDDSSSEEMYSRSQGRRRRAKGPVWVTLAQHQAASDRWDAQGICYEIDTQWGAMPMGGAYSDSLRYPQDGLGGYLGEGFGF